MPLGFLIFPPQHFFVLILIHYLKYDIKPTKQYELELSNHFFSTGELMCF